MTIKVIGVGLGRTGTHSLKLALEYLDFNPCDHMIELLRNPERIKYWQALKRGNARACDALFAGFQAAVDYPTNRYYELLLTHYPNAKVILTVRDPDDWYESAMDTLYKGNISAFEIINLGLHLPFSNRARQLAQIFCLDLQDWPHSWRFRNKKRAIEYFQRHNDKVIQTVPEARLLIYRVTEGWQPLVNFLECPLPDIEFPHSNNRQSFKAIQRKGIKQFLHATPSQIK